jgi:hypothetical protein
MSQITTSMLRKKIDFLNEITGNPLQPWVTTPNGTRAAVGNYHLSGAYGGYALHRHVTDGGGVTDIFSRGHMPKRELYDLICAYISGFETAKRG